MKAQIVRPGRLAAGIGLAVAVTLAGFSGVLAAPKPTKFFKVSGKTVTLTLISAYNNNNFAYNFDGYAKGKMVVSVPLGTTIHVVCTASKKASVNHSCAITRKLSDTKPAFSGAATKSPQTGLAPGQTEKFTFIANKKGTYKIICLVPGHADAGMWDTLKVTKGGSPSIKSK